MHINNATELRSQPAADLAPLAAGSSAVAVRSPTAIRLSKPPGATGELFGLYLAAFLVLHLLLPLACVPWLFSWTGVILVFVGNYVFGSLGINLAYHRILTHQGLIVPKWLEHTLAVLGVCSLQE